MSTRLTDEKRRQLLKNAHLNDNAKQFINDVLDEIHEILDIGGEEAHAKAAGTLFGHIAALSEWVHPSIRENDE